MEPERWRRIEELYHSAIGRAVDQRSAFLEEACEDDDALRRQVQLLLSHSDSTDLELGFPVWEIVARRAESAVGLPAGTRLGPYKILGSLGEGAMGTVYQALDTRLDRAVAIKVSAAQFSERFEREARAISALNHPNICALYDVGADFLVMELVDGETLAQRLVRVGSLPVSEGLSICLQIAEALEEAHRKRIIHRDLKPANVKITPTGRVKVLDFSLAKRVREDRADVVVSALTAATGIETGAGQLLGTPAYMSPEQASGLEVDTRTDVWAFGCLLFELLTGKRAFQGNTAADTVAAILESEPDWQALPVSTPVKIRHLLRQSLEKAAVRRLPDIEAARAVLENVMKPRSRALSLRQLTAISTLLVAALLAAWLRSGRDERTGGMGHAVPLTTYPGSQDWPSFSPDGNEVAFSWDGDGQDNFDIYVKPIGSGHLRRLTHDPAADTAPAWAPDGRSIAFLRASQPGKSEVMFISPEGGPERALAEISRFEPMNEGLAWWPDNKWLVVSDRPPNEASGLWLVSTETAERRRLTRAPDEGASSGDFVPAPAADGRLLAFRRLVARNSSDLFILPMGDNVRPAGELRRLTRDT